MLLIGHKKNTKQCMTTPPSFLLQTESPFGRFPFFDDPHRHKTISFCFVFCCCFFLSVWALRCCERVDVVFRGWVDPQKAGGVVRLSLRSVYLWYDWWTLQSKGWHRIVQKEGNKVQYYGEDWTGWVEVLGGLKIVGVTRTKELQT